MEDSVSVMYDYGRLEACTTLTVPLLFVGMSSTMCLALHKLRSCSRGTVGCPAKEIRLLKALHTNVTVTIQMDGEEVIVLSISGVKQGDICGPEK